VSISIAALAKLIVYPDEEIQRITLLSLYYFCCLEDRTKHYVIRDYKLIPKIVSFIDHQDLDIKVLALKIAGRLSNADAKMTNVL